MKLTYTILLCFFSLICFSQKAINVKVSTTDNELMVTYNLEGKRDVLYQVDLHFENEDGTTIKPKSVRGDIGKVPAGPGKIIIWEVYKDVDELSGNLNPIVDVKEISAPKANTPSKPQPTPKPAPPPQVPTVDVQNDDIIKKKNRKRTFRTGFKVGVGNTQVIASSNQNSYRKKLSWEGGMFFRWNAAKRVYLQPELIYHQQSYEEIFNNTESAAHLNHYARAQLLAGVSPLGWGLYVNGGLYYGQLLGGREKQILTSGTTTTNLQNIEPQNGEDSPYLTNDAGFLLGGSLNLFKGAFAMGVLYSQSFDSFVNRAFFEGGSEADLQLTNKGVHFFIQKKF